MEEDLAERTKTMITMINSSNSPDVDPGKTTTTVGKDISKRIKLMRPYISDILQHFSTNFAPLLFLRWSFQLQCLI